MRNRGKGATQTVWGSFERLPWYFSLATAAAGYVVIGKVAPRVASMSGGDFGLLAAVCDVASLTWLALFAFAAILSWARARHRDQLLHGLRSVQEIRRLGWRDFERLLAAFYVQEGFFVELTGGGGADGGVDLVIRRKGVTSLVQAKQWRSTSVGVGVVREMRGLMAARNVSGGVIVCSGSFTKDAQRFGLDNGVTLIDGPCLAAMLRSVNGGDQIVDSTRCPECGGAMKVRLNRRKQVEFMGCEKFPSCDGTREMQRLH